MLAQQDHGTSTSQAPLLIAHGLFGSGRNWGVIAKRLSDERRVINVDMRNHGNSPWSDSHSYQDLAADLAEVIEKIGTPVDLLGHSMGGKAAMTLALVQPDLLRRLIIADIAPVPYSHTQMAPIAAMRGVDLSQVTNRAEAAAQMHGIEDALKPFLLQSLDLKEKKWRLNLDALADQMPNIMGFPVLKGQFEGGTLFLTGANSDYVTADHRSGIKNLFPNARFAKIRDAGHWLHAEKPREFEASVRAFLNA